ncbi:type I DNA topoisomerase [Candidatus Uhrbacteria bacterium]|nr:type I DNA topoisomerase [Candidatus Uhrbacteria bacterium]
MIQNLVIVESPTKAKTIHRFLGKGFKVESSFGHVRDLPKSELGVDVEHGFKPKYVIPRAARKRVNALKKMATDAKKIYFATDEDREGEAISWHLQQIFDIPKEKTARIAFHEITQEAIHDALEHPRMLDVNLVDAQQARRVLDRLVGYELSPFLWRKIARGLSAGRVQSVAVRLIVEREREIQNFVQQEYWSIECVAHKKNDPQIFRIKLHAQDGKTLDKFALTTEESAQKIIKDIDGAKYTVIDVVKKDVKRTPPPPFITSTLQQEANKRLHFSAKQTMMLAQQLYEGIEADEGAGGYITYMRTDSVNLAEKFLQETKSYIKKTYGSTYECNSRRYATKSKLAQEAHEAIRPTSIDRTPDSIRQFLTDQQYKLYDLIWRRALASQMPVARLEATTIDSEAKKQNIPQYIFRASGQVLAFDGFLKVYLVGSEEILLPYVEKGEVIDVDSVEPLQHVTKPPARYSEAGLVRMLEEYGIGRPSTYAPTISTIIDRNYVVREDRRLKPTELAFMVTDLLVAHFPNIVDYAFTAHMEDTLDEVAEGKKEWAPIIRDFYGPFKENLMKKDKEISKKSLIAEETDEVCEKCGKPMVVRMGRYGKFLACSGFPECKNIKSLPGSGDTDGRTDGEQETKEICELCGAPLQKKRGKFGFFWGCTKYPDCTFIKSFGQKKLGIPCPTCSKGEVIQRRSKKGKIYYACSRGKECEFISWTRPEVQNTEKTS